MPDVHSTAQRRRNMQAIKSKNTKPEMIVRRLVHSMGFRYRLHRRDLPGTPDLVFPKLKRVIFVHGCYWHKHNCRYGRVTPKTNALFWQKKRQANVERDRLVMRKLRKLGWRPFVVWECQVRSKPEWSCARIRKFLSQPNLG